MSYLSEPSCKEQEEILSEFLRALPLELMWEIADYLDPRTLANFCLVSQGFRTWARRKLYQHPELTGGNFDICRLNSATASNIELARYIQGLSVSMADAWPEYEYEALARATLGIIERCKMLRSVWIEELPDNPYEEMVASAVRSRDLTVLKMPYFEQLSLPELIGCTFPRLQKLTIVNYEDELPLCRQEHAPDCAPSQSLRHLCLDDTCLATGDLEWLLRRCPKLEYFGLDLRVPGAKLEEFEVMVHRVTSAFEYGPKSLYRLRVLGHCVPQTVARRFLSAAFEGCDTIRVLSTNDIFCDHDFLQTFGPRLQEFKLALCPTYGQDCLPAVHMLLVNLLHLQTIFPRLKRLTVVDLTSEADDILGPMTKDAIVDAGEAGNLSVEII